MFIENKKIINYFSYLFYLFPFFLISGPFFPDLFISAISIVLIFFIINKKSIKNNFFKFLILFYFYIVFNSFFSDFKLISLETSILHIRFIIFSFVLFFLISKNFNLINIILWSFFISYLVLLLDSYIQIIFGYNVLGYPYTERLSSFFGKKLVMGSYISRTLPIVLGVSFVYNFKYKKFFQIFILMISANLIYFSGERLASMYYLLILFSYLIITFKKKEFFLVMLSFILLFLSLGVIKKDSYVRLINSSLNQFKEINNNIIFLSYRHQLHFITSINMFKDRIFLGHGIKSFRYLCDNEKYVPLQKIINDNTVYSPIDGYVSFKYSYIDPNGFYLVIHPNINNDFDPAYIKNNKVAGIFVKNIFGQLLITYKNSGDFVNKNEPVVVSYEFLNGCNTHPHNIHLQFLSELGLFGYSFLIFAFVFISYQLLLLLIKFAKKKINNDDKILFFLFLGLFSSLFPLFPSGNFFNNWLSSIFYLNLGITIYFFYQNKKKNK
jgi:O-antigen ligase